MVRKRVSENEKVAGKKQRPLEEGQMWKDSRQMCRLTEGKSRDCVYLSAYGKGEEI